MGIRNSIAGWFGRAEHEAGRVIVIPILATAYFAYEGYSQYAFYSSIVVFVVWLIYLLSHFLEKKFYGKGLRGYR